MAIGFWQLPENISVAIQTPQVVLNLLTDRILLEQTGPSEVVRVVKLDWVEQSYRSYKSAYWQQQFTREDVVWRESEAGWLFLGDGFFLAYSKLTDSAEFFVRTERLDDVVTYGYPFLNLLVYLLNGQGYACLHAAVIGANDSFALIPGKQNTGKSTTSATWVLNGGQFVTDDFCFVQAEKPTIAHGFYPSLRLREQALPLINTYVSAGMLQQKGDSKYFFSLLTHARERFVTEATLRTILCLTLQNQAISHTHVGPKVGFEYLASSVAFSIQYRSDSSICLQVIKKLVRELPVLQVNLSPNAEENYSYLSELLAAY